MHAARMIGSRAAWKAAARVMLALATMVAPAGAQGRGGRGQQAEPEPLKWRFMGPSVGNRIAAVAGVPGDPTIYYAGAASGGVWKSTDSGATFTPVFDGQRVAAIGALAVAATDPNIVWAGTGEAWVIRPSDVIGDGIYKSTDAGATWTRMGLEETGRIGRVIVHPTDPEHRLRLRARAHDGSATGTGRVQDDRRRSHVESRALRRYEHRLLRPLDGCQESRGALCRYLAGRNAPVGDAQRRARQRNPRDTRRRRHVDPRDAQRTSEVTASARSMSLLRPPTPAASTLSFRPLIRARSGARTTAGARGRSSAGTARSSAAPATTCGSAFRPSTRTKCSSRTAAHIARPTAASPSSRGAAAATATTSGSIRRTPIASR